MLSRIGLARTSVCPKPFLSSPGSLISDPQGRLGVQAGFGGDEAGNSLPIPQQHAQQKQQPADAESKIFELKLFTEVDITA